MFVHLGQRLVKCFLFVGLKFQSLGVRDRSELVPQGRNLLTHLSAQEELRWAGTAVSRGVTEGGEGILELLVSHVSGMKQGLDILDRGLR